MLHEIFNIENFNIISDEDNYYFLRALNNADNFDIDNYITVGENGNILTIRTDRSRYDKIPKYKENSTLSLNEIFDHIKVHHRLDTNCISLSSNANVSLLYGREYYKDKYVLVKIPKKEFGQKVVNAGLYMMNQIENKINEFIINGELSNEIVSYLNLIDNVKSKQELVDLMNSIKKVSQSDADDDFEKGIKHNFSETNSINYITLNDSQNLEKDKLVAKLDIINKNIIPNVSNRFLIQTLGNAFSSLELIHYGSINKDEIIQIKKEFVDIFSLLQQLPANYDSTSLKKEVLRSVLINNNIKSFDYDSYEINKDTDYTIDKMYELTNGSVSYQDAINMYKKSFYLSKSKLRALNAVNNLKLITNNNSEYNDIYNYLINHTYGVEPLIFSRSSTSNMKVSESVGLDFKVSEKELFDFVNNLQVNDLTYIIKNPEEALKYYLSNFRGINHINVDKDTYYANAIIDMFDWASIGVVNFGAKQRNDLVNKLIENNVTSMYQILKDNNFKEKDICKILLTIIIKQKKPYEIDVNDMFTTEELDDFLGYYKLNNTNSLKLRSYQALAYKNINKALEEKQFVSAVLPTGAGKSFVALSEMLRYKDKKILYLAPNYEILDQIEDYIVKYIHGNTTTKTNKQIVKEVFPNLKLQTYSSLLSFNQKEIINNKYDLIIFDELHRTGAEEWGNHINQLLENQDKNMRLLGITATPIRDMDNRNMAEEWARYYGYTDNEINAHKYLAINMDLIDAIKLGYVVNPKLVNCEYTLKSGDLMYSLIEKINQIDEDEKRNSLIKKFDVLRRKVEEADGVDKVLKDNVKMGGKYIVFCPVVNKNGDLLEDVDGNEEDYRLKGDEIIEKYKKELLQYFSEEDVEFYSMLGSYSRAKNRMQLAKFENQNSKKIKFMIVMNKLSEGKHADIDGIIWYRPLDENSFILYHQQLGRVIFSVDPNKSLSEEKRPVIIDLVSNHLRVSMNKNKAKGKTSDLDRMILVADWVYEHDYKIPDINSYDNVESSYGLSLKRIQEKYIKYIDEPKLLEELDKNQKQEVEEIIRLGNDITIWDFEFPDIIKKHVKKSNFTLDDFSLTGILKDYYDLNLEADKLIKPSSFEDRLKEIYDISEGDITKVPKGGDTRKFKDGSARIALWINYNSEYIKESALKENESAILIAASRKWEGFEHYLDELRLKEIYDMSEGDITKVPKGEDTKKFKDGSAQIAQWIKNNFEYIKEMALKGNKSAILIAASRKWEGFEHYLYELRLKEIYDISEGDIIKVPKGLDTRKFKDGSARIAQWIKTNSEYIKESALKGNKYAILIAASKKWEGFEHYLDELRLKEIYDISEGDITKVPKGGDTRKFKDGSAQIAQWINTNSEYIKESALKGNKYAILIAASKKWEGFEHYLDELRLKEIYDISEGDITKVPKGGDTRKFKDGSAQIAQWINTNSEYIKESALKGNKYAILIAASRKWEGFEHYLDELRLKEIYDISEGDIIKVPKGLDTRKFKDGSARIALWITRNSEYIKESALKGNKSAILIATARGWIDFTKSKEKFDSESEFNKLIEKAKKKVVAKDDGKLY